MRAAPRVGDVASRNLPLVSADQSLAKAAEVMLATGSLGVVTTDAQRRPALVLSYRGLVKTVAGGAGSDARVADHAVSDPVVVAEYAGVGDALEIMRDEAVRFLPVVDSRGRLVAVLEPDHVAYALWDTLDYGLATVETRLRKLVALPADASIRVAAKAMHENGVPEILVRLAGGEHRILREEDFLRAVAEGRIDEGTVGEYARGQVVKIPSWFDAKAAVELMRENGVRRLLVEAGDRLTVVTVTDLAFEAWEAFKASAARETGFVLVRTEVGREQEIASRIILEEGVKEVFVVTGEYDVLVRVEGESLRDVYKVVRDKIRSLPGVVETRTLVGVRVAAKTG